MILLPVTEPRTHPAAILRAAVPAEARNLLSIDADPRMSHEQTRAGAEALAEAVRRVLTGVRLSHKVHLVFGFSPFSIALSSGTLAYTPKPEVIQSYVAGIVFIEVGRLLEFPLLSERTLLLVEELLHAITGVKDGLVEVLVTQLCPEFEFVDGRYKLRGPTTPTGV